MNKNKIVYWNWHIGNRIWKNFEIEKRSISEKLEWLNFNEQIHNIITLDKKELFTLEIMDEINKWNSLIWSWYFSDELVYILDKLKKSGQKYVENFLLFWTNWFDVNPELDFPEIVLNASIKKEQINWLSPSNFWISIYHNKYNDNYWWFIETLKNKWLEIKISASTEELRKAIYLKSCLNTITNVAWVIYCDKIYNSINKLNLDYLNFWWLDWLISELILLVNSITPWILEKQELYNLVLHTIDLLPNAYTSSVYNYWDLEKKVKKKIKNGDIHRFLSFLINNADKLSLKDKIPILISMYEKVNNNYN
jgi:hypothetical protein